MNELVLYEILDRVGYITLNRPEKRNALSYEMVSALKEQISKAISDKECKVIVLRGNGEAFCSGADLASLQQLQNNTYEENMADSAHLAELFMLIYQAPKIIISMVMGAAYAGGFGLATVCDYCFADTYSKFSYTEVKIGFIPAIVMVFLLRQIGDKKARRILLSGEQLDAKTAHQIGVVYQVLDPSVIEEVVHAFALKLCKQTSGQSIARTKSLLAKVQELPLEEAVNLAIKENAEARASSDCQKGINAFLNKEKISW